MQILKVAKYALQRRWRKMFCKNYHAFQAFSTNWVEVRGTQVSLLSCDGRALESYFETKSLAVALRLAATLVEGTEVPRDYRLRYATDRLKVGDHLSIGRPRCTQEPADFGRAS